MADTTQTGYTGEYGFADGSVWQNGVQIKPPTAAPSTPAPTGGLNIPPTTSLTTTTSDPVRQALDQLNSNITKTSSTPISYNGQTYTDTTSLLDAQRKQLDQRRKDEVTRIEGEFDAAKVDQDTAQRKETGSSSMGLARIGGFDSASGQAVLTNLERVHVQEQQALIGKRQAAITMAQQAYEDKDFALAQTQLQEAKEAEQKIYDRQKDFLNLTLQYKSDQRADLQFEFQKTQADKADAKAALEFTLQHGIDKPFFVAGGIGYDSSTGEKLSYDDYISRGGKPDFSNAHIITPGSEEDRAFVQTLRNNYPDANISSSDTAETASAKIRNSAIYRKETYIAPPGGAAGAKTAAQSNVISSAKTALDAEASTSADGKANPTTYRDQLSKYIQAGGDANDFYKAVSLDQYIDDKNRKGDLVGTNLDYRQQTTMSYEEKQAEVTSILDKYGVKDLNDPKANQIPFTDLSRIIELTK